MIKHIWSIVCLDSLIDKDTKSISLIRVLEEFKVYSPEEIGKIIVPPLNLQVVTLFGTDVKNAEKIGDCKISFFNPIDEILGIFEFDINFKRKVRSRNISKIQGLPVNIPGDYEFKIEYKENNSPIWELATTLPLVINIKSIEKNKSFS